MYSRISIVAGCLKNGGKGLGKNMKHVKKSPAEVVTLEPTTSQLPVVCFTSRVGTEPADLPVAIQSDKYFKP